MQPLFFGDTKTQLFGIYHAPTGKLQQRAIVLCNPLGAEHIRAHRCLRQLAVRLSNEGAHVFRFDYFGTGDSAGSLADASLDIWLQNIVQAIDELKAMSTIRHISLLGLRLGATLAVLTAEKRSDIDCLLLWDPVLRGDDYLESLRSVHEAMLVDLDRFGMPRSIEACHENELVGSCLPPQLVSDIRSLSLTSINVEGLRRCYIVNSFGDSKSGDAEHVETKFGLKPEYIEIDDNLNWNDAKMIKAVIPNNSIGVITKRIMA